MSSEERITPPLQDSCFVVSRRSLVDRFGDRFVHGVVECRATPVANHRSRGALEGKLAELELAEHRLRTRLGRPRRP